MSEDSTTLEAGAVFHRDPPTIAWAHELLTTHAQRVGEGGMGRVAASGEPLFIPKISADEWAASTSPEYRQILERLRVGSVMVVPMLCRGKVVGVATLLRSGPANPYTDSDLHLFRNVADHAALAIANARSYAAECAARAAAVSANEALHESEDAHRLLFDASPIPLIVFDIDTLDHLAVNDAALRLYGYARDEFMRTRASDLTIEGDIDSSKERLITIGEAEITGTVGHRRKNGSHMLVEYTSRTLAFGGHRARIAVISDVTAHHQAEQTRALLAAIVQSSNDAIVRMRLDGTITSWNDAAERLFGYSAEEALGRPISILFPPDRLSEQRFLLGRIQTGGRVEHYETVRRRKDGTDVEVSVSLSPIMNAAGKVVGASKTARDLTAQRHSDAALRRTEEQLRQAQKMENEVAARACYASWLGDDPARRRPRTGANGGARHPSTKWV